MHYESRWINAFWVGGLIIIVGFFYDIKPKWNEYHELNHKFFLLKKEILVKKKKLHDRKKSHNFIILSDNDKKNQEAHALFLIVEAMNAQGLSLQKAIKKVSAIKEKKDVIVFHVIAEGNFKKVYSFMMMLFQYSNFLTFLDFSYLKNAEKKFIFTADIAFFHPKKIENITMFKFDNKEKWVDPFCSNQDFYLHFNEENLTHYSVFQMKIIGFLQLAFRQEAWMKLPNQSIFSVKVGDVIGKERARITHLSTDEMVMLFPNHEKHVLKKEP